MATWSALHSELLPQVLGCSQPLADQALCLTARDFCSRTYAWREWLEPTKVTGRTDYDLDAPAGALVVRIERATLDGRHLDIVSSAGLASNELEYEQPQRGVVSRDRVSFTTTRQLTPDAHIEVEATLMPKRDANGMPDWFFAQHGEALVNGALARLMLTRNTTFFDPDLAAVARADYQAEVGRQGVASWTGATGKIPRPRARWC